MERCRPRARYSRAVLIAKREPSDRDLARRALQPKLFPHEIIALVYVITGIVLLERLPVTYPRQALWQAYLTFFGPIVLLAYLVSRLVRRRFPSSTWWEDAAVLGRIGAVLAFTLPIHFLLKSFISLINPRTWDLELARWDQALHFGISPSRFLVALFRNPIFLNGLDIVYSAAYYFFIVGTTAICFALLSQRMRFVLGSAYMLLWMSGALLYIAFPTWGPVFVFSNDFQASLASMPITRSIQHELYLEISSLINNPLGPRVVRFGSVAAFPSLHVGEVLLLALASRSVSKRWFAWNLVFLALIVIGSVVTGYHYLIDTYGGLAIAALAWWLGGKLFPKTPSPVAPYEVTDSAISSAKWGSSPP